MKVEPVCLKKNITILAIREMLIRNLFESLFKVRGVDAHEKPRLRHFCSGGVNSMQSHLYICITRPWA